jgi:hypothetical protein
MRRLNYLAKSLLGEFFAKFRLESKKNLLEKILRKILGKGLRSVYFGKVFCGKAKVFREGLKERGKGKIDGKEGGRFPSFDEAGQ